MQATKTSTLRMGVIGVGQIGRMHVELLARQVPGAAVSVIHDAQEATARDVADELGIPATGDVDELLSTDEVDAVPICSSTDTHAGLIVAAARAGKSIFGEKPVSMDLAIVGPRVELRVEVNGTPGAVSWELERMNELQRFQLSDNGGDARAMPPSWSGRRTATSRPSQPGAGDPMGYDDPRVTEARSFLAAVRDGEQRAPGVDEMLSCARVHETIERSDESAQWEPAR